MYVTMTNIHIMYVYTSVCLFMCMCVCFYTVTVIVLDKVSYHDSLCSKTCAYAIPTSSISVLERENTITPLKKNRKYV